MAKKKKAKHVGGDQKRGKVGKRRPKAAPAPPAKPTPAPPAPPPASGASVHGKKAAVLSAYGECCRIDRACQLAEVGRQTHYDWMREDQDYREQFTAVREQVTDRLEDEAVRRAHEGVERLKFSEGVACYDPRTGNVYVEREFSDTLLIFLLKAARPEKYRERHETKHTGGIEVEYVNKLPTDGDEASD